MTDLMSNQGVCRTAPASRDLLIITQFVSSVSKVCVWEYKKNYLSCDILDIEFHKIEYCLHYNYALLHP